MHLQNDRGAGNGAYTRKGTIFQVLWWPVGPKLVFDQMAAPVPEIMDEYLQMCRKTKMLAMDLQETATRNDSVGIGQKQFMLQTEVSYS
jgi:hypothetical protein